MNQKIDPPRLESDGTSSFFLNTHRLSEENGDNTENQIFDPSDSSQQNSNYGQSFFSNQVPDV